MRDGEAPAGGRPAEVAGRHPRRRRLPFVMGGLAACMLVLAGCGSTIVTRVQPRSVLGGLPAGSLRQQARTIEKRAEITRRSPEEASRDLAKWAGTDGTRLTEAAEAILYLGARSKHPSSRSGFPLGAAELAYRGLLASGIPVSSWLNTAATRRTMAVYNEALDRFVAANAVNLARGVSLETLWTPLGSVEVSTKFMAHPPYGAGYFDTFIPADRVSVRGVGARVVSEGLGSPLVGVRNRTADREQEMYYQPTRRGVFAAFAAVARFRSDPPARMRALVELVDLNRHSAISIDGGRIALAGDFTAPFALSFRGINDLLLGISGVTNIAKRREDAGLYLTEPFDPDRIPVVLIHGLTSSPLVWRSITTRLMGDPRIRRNYQFWYVYYPTGLPIAQSAASIRKDIKVLRQRYDPGGTSRASRHLVIVGYSMGGVIARILSTEMGTRYWDAIAKIPFDEAPIDPDDRAALREMLFWDPVPGIDRTVFIATPHRGTRMADSTIAGIGRRLVGFPRDYLGFQRRVLGALGDILEGNFATMRVVTGISSLSPSSPLYAALDRAPFAPGLKFHSIIGDRGKNDSPNSTDGIVGYWSSHLDSAESELIVPSGHDAHLKSTSELHRILLLNLQYNRRKS